MLPQVQTRDKAYLGGQSNAAESRDFNSQQSYEKFLAHMNESTPSQRIDILIYLWGGQNADEENSAKTLVDQYVSSSITDDQNSEKSVKFSLALTITAEFSHYLNLEHDNHHQLNSILSSSDDYESMGKQVINLLEPLQTVSPQADTRSEGRYQEASPSLIGSDLSSYAGIHAEVPQTLPSTNPAVVEKDTTRRSEEKEQSHHAIRRKTSSRRQFGLRSSEPIGPSTSKKLKIKLSKAFGHIADSVHSARKAVFKLAGYVARSVRQSFKTFKEAIQIRSQKFSESITNPGASVEDSSQGKTMARIKSKVSRSAKQLAVGAKRVLRSLRKFGESMTETGMEAGEAFTGKPFARIKSSVSRAGERIVGGGRKVLKAVTSAVKVVAHGAVHGMKAAASFLGKAVSFVGNRFVALRGFDRV
jgi:predicted HicB family RNase H-like nuclease